MKYNEDIILNLIKDYIRNTYGEHYSTTEEGFQVMDILRNLEIDKDFCQANAIKYLMRYGKKDGHNEKDLYKAVHYIVLLISSSQKDNHKGTPDKNKKKTKYTSGVNEYAEAKRKKYKKQERTASRPQYTDQSYFGHKKKPKKRKKGKRKFCKECGIVH